MTAVQQSAAPHPAVRQRIDWIDTAKGLCMILVIVGHTLPYGNLMRNFIFSFHMPAFFFLTGYTARRPDTWQGFARRVRKDFVALIVPVLGVVQVFNVLLNFFLSDDRSLTNLWDIARYNAITLFWASGNPADGIPSCGMPWFLFALFWGQADLGAAGAFVPQRGFCRQFHCHAVRGIHRAGTVSSPMSGCCNGRCHVPHIGAAVPPASGTVGSLPGPAFPCHADSLGMVLPAGHLY